MWARLINNYTKNARLHHFLVVYPVLKNEEMTTESQRCNCFTRNGETAIPKHASPEAKGSNPTTGLTLLWVHNSFRGNFNHLQVSRKEAGQIYVNRMPRNRLPRVMKHYSPTGRRNHGRSLKRLLDTWDRNGSTSGPTPWKINDDDDVRLQYISSVKVT